MTEIINGVLTSPIDLKPVVIDKPIAKRGRNGHKYFKYITDIDKASPFRPRKATKGSAYNQSNIEKTILKASVN